MTAAENLQAFYEAYAQWIEEGAPPEMPFRRDTGLCANLIRFVFGVSERTVSKAVEAREARDLLTVQFKLAGLDPVTPFQKEADYWREGARCRHHLNDRRNAWVFDHID